MRRFRPNAISWHDSWSPEDIVALESPYVAPESLAPAIDHNAPVNVVQEIIPGAVGPTGVPPLNAGETWQSSTGDITNESGQVVAVGGNGNRVDLLTPEETVVQLQAQQEAAQIAEPPGMGTFGINVIPEPVEVPHVTPAITPDSKRIQEILSMGILPGGTSEPAPLPNITTRPALPEIVQVDEIATQEKARPNVFGFLGDALSTVWGAADRALGGYLPGGVTPQQMQGLQNAPPISLPMSFPSSGGPPVLQSRPLTTGPGFMGPPRPQTAPAPGKVPTTRMVRPIHWTSGPPPADGRRYVPNKAPYFRRDPMSGAVVKVEPGQVWVRPRRRNSLNPRALSRAISRVDGFGRAHSSAKKRIRKADRRVNGAPRRRAPRS